MFCPLYRIFGETPAPMKRFCILLVLILSVLPLETAGKPRKPIKVSCIGDSITYGLMLENREQEAYPVQLQRMLGKNYLVGNFGKSGATLLRKGHRPYMEQEEFRKAMDFAGDIVVIHLGINDTDPRDWPLHGEDFVQDYLTLIDIIKNERMTPKPQEAAKLSTDELLEQISRLKKKKG